MALGTCYGNRLSLEIFSPSMNRKKKLCKSRKKVESVIKASITNKKNKTVILITCFKKGRNASHQLNRTPSQTTIWECVSCAQTCLNRKTCFLFYVPECSSRAMLYYYWGRLLLKRRRKKKNDELQQQHQQHFTFSRSLHIIVHNHW